MWGNNNQEREPSNPQHKPNGQGQPQRPNSTKNTEAQKQTTREHQEKKTTRRKEQTKAEKNSATPGAKPNGAGHDYRSLPRRACDPPPAETIATKQGRDTQAHSKQAPQKQEQTDR